MKINKQTLNNFNGNLKSICEIFQPHSPSELNQLPHSLIARGCGANYGDAAFHTHHAVLCTRQLNHVIEFDSENGILIAEAGITLAEILHFTVKKGWFLPVTPGTQQVTLGGCAASDVHGKNQHRAGSFGSHILWLELLTAQQEIIQCSNKNNIELFNATVGGMGLTGIITKIALQLLAIQTPFMQVSHHTTLNLENTLDYLSQEKYDDDYSIAWIDIAAKKQQFCRGILLNAHHALPTEISSVTTSKLIARQKNKIANLFIPRNIINNATIKIFNQFYFHKQSQKINSFTTSYQQYFYPLDKLKDWPKLYGKKGFIQYQCVLPPKTAHTGYQEIFEYLQLHQYTSFLAVLKKFGHGSTGLLSFAMPGYTLAVDLPLRNRDLHKHLDYLDNIVVKNGGRIYLAKDMRTPPEIFRAMYPKIAQWQLIKAKVDPHWHFNSDLAKRLQLQDS